MIGKQEKNKLKVNMKRGDAVTVTRRRNITRAIRDNSEDNTWIDMYYGGNNLFGILEYYYPGSVYGHFVTGQRCIHPYELNKHEIYDARLDI